MVTETEIWTLNQTVLLGIKNTIGGVILFIKVISAEVCGFVEVLKSKTKVKFCYVTIYSPVPNSMGWWNFSKPVKGVFILAQTLINN